MGDRCSRPGSKIFCGVVTVCASLLSSTELVLLADAQGLEKPLRLRVQVPAGCCCCWRDPWRPGDGVGVTVCSSGTSVPSGLEAASSFCSWRTGIETDLPNLGVRLAMVAMAGTLLVPVGVTRNYFDRSEEKTLKANKFCVCKRGVALGDEAVVVRQRSESSWTPFSERNGLELDETRVVVENMKIGYAFEDYVTGCNRNDMVIKSWSWSLARHAHGQGF